MKHSKLEAKLQTLSPDGAAERLAALADLVKLVPGSAARSGANLHLHTGESYSLYPSPSSLVWAARGEGLATIGINDLYATGGHAEFAEACNIAGLDATLSVELIALDETAFAAGALWNDPSNPGRTYLCGKGTVRPLPPDSESARRLDAVNAALRQRHRRMTVLATEWLATHDCGPVTWEDAVGRTARGNVTERHVAEALADSIKAACGEAWPQRVREWFDADATDESLPVLLRSKLLKAGGPAFVPESQESFLSWPQTREMFLAFGAVPTYPILGDPVTDGEADIDSLLDRLIDLGWHAVEVIPRRNTPERIAAIVAGARARDLPCFAGTEHNTKDRIPLRHASLLDPQFRDWYERSARVLLGHQRLAAAGEVGYVDATGEPFSNNRPAAAERCLAATPPLAA